MAGDRTEARDGDPVALREEWLDRLSRLEASVRGWVEREEWATRRIDKKMKESRLGSYEAPALLMQKGPTRILLDPIARFAPGVEGVVDLYLMPAYDDIASLYLVEGEWRLHYPSEDAEGPARPDAGDPRPLTRESLLEVLDKMLVHAS